MKDKHTPGPWRVDETWNLITAEDGMIEVAACHTGERMAPKRNSHKTATANARLIAAAAKAIGLDKMGRAAIAKAEGAA